MDWLGAHNLMQCHWLEKTIAFETDDKQVQLQVVRTTDLPPISKLDAYELHRMEVANDIRTAALVTVEPQRKARPTPVPPIFSKCYTSMQMCSLN